MNSSVVSRLRRRRLSERRLRTKVEQVRFYCENHTKYAKLLVDLMKHKLLEDNIVKVEVEDLSVSAPYEVYKGNEDLQGIFHKWAKPEADYDLMNAGNPATKDLE